MKVEQMMKHIWVACLMLIIGVVSLAIPSKAATLTEGDYEYEILEDGTAKITRYIGSDTEITIPSTLGGKQVTEILFWNSMNFDKITKVTIPDGVISVGGFSACTSLESVTFPESVTTLKSSAFAGCVSLTNIIIPESVTSIEPFAFSGCVRLESIVIPKNVTVLESSVFQECTNLKNVTLPDGITSIEDCAFLWCTSIETLQLPSKLKIIESYAFGGCTSLKNVTIPDGVTSLKGAFQSCTGLQQVTIPASVTFIDAVEFCHEEWENGEPVRCYIPEALKIYTTPGSYAAEWVKENAPDNDASATPDPDPQPTPNPDSQPATPNQTPTQTPSGATPAQTGQNTAKLPAAKGTILTVPEWKCQVRVISDAAADPTVEYLATTNKKASTIKVPDSVTVDGITYKVTAVADKALAGNKKVKKVVLGVNVTSVGKNAFAKCKNLKKIEVKSSRWSKKSVGKNAFKGTSKKLVVKVPKKMTSAYKKYVKGKGNKTVRVK